MLLNAGFRCCVGFRLFFRLFGFRLRRLDFPLPAAGFAVGIQIVGILVLAVAVFLPVTADIAAIGKAFVPVAVFIRGPLVAPEVLVRRHDLPLPAAGFTVGIQIVGIFVLAVAVLLPVTADIAAISKAFVPVAVFIRGPLVAPEVLVLRRDLPLPAAGFTVGIQIVGIFVLAVAVLLAVTSDIAAIGKAFVPVAVFIRGPLVAPEVLMGLFWDKLRIERTADGANALCIIVQFCKLTIFLKDQAAIGTFIYGMSAVAVGFRKLQFTAAIPVMVAGTHGTDPVTRPIHPVFVRTAGFFVDFAAVVTLLIMLVGQDDPLTVGAVTQRLAGFLGLLTATFTFDYPDTGFGTGGTVGRLLAVVIRRDSCLLPACSGKWRLNRVLWRGLGLLANSLILAGIRTPQAVSPGSEQGRIPLCSQQGDAE